MNSLDKSRTFRYWDHATDSEAERIYTDREILTDMSKGDYNYMHFEDILKAIGRTVLQKETGKFDDLMTDLAKYALSKEKNEN